jgi:PAS domain S-box-containing protein
MTACEPIKILLVEDDEDDFILTRELLAEIPGRRFTLDWARTFEEGLEILARNQHAVALVDYRLGAHNGIELLRAAIERGCSAPVILLTGLTEHQTDLEAMEAGAADYLVKGRLAPDSLERSLRYAIQRSRAAALAAFEQARLADFGAQIGLAVTLSDPLEAILQSCAQAMVRHLSADFAQIAIFDPVTDTFETRAAACVGPNQADLSWPVPRLDAHEIRARKPIFIKSLLNCERMPGQEWIEREGLVGYAAYPLVLDDELVGLMSVFTRGPVREEIGQEMGSVANGIALCILRKRSEQALDASEVKYRALVENIQEVIFQLDEFGNWTFLNPAWSTVTGFEVQATLGTFFLEYVHQDDRQQNRLIFLQLIEGRIDYCRYETRLLSKAGKVRCVEVYAQLARLGENARLGICGSLTDITERKLAETQIQKLAAFPTVNPNPVLEFAADGSLTYANEAVHEMAKSLGQSDLFAILPQDVCAIARDCLATCEKRLRQEVSIAGRTITWSFFPVVGSQVVHCYGTDVTEMLSLEAQFRHAQKLESVGQLAAGVAHDFNNILTIIQGYSDTLLTKCGADASLAGPLKQISDASRRAAALTRQLLLFSRKQVMQPKILDLNAALRNLANMLPRLLREDIILQADYAADLPRIEADAGMLEQIVMNLAVNARDAMPNGGQLLIRTAVAEISQDYANRRPDSRPGQFVCLTMTDTGCGMDDKTLQRIFEPFFSTKEVGKGTGLGLATVYGIVKQHRGWIEVASQVGAGTTFQIFFPAAVQPVEASSEAATGPEEVQGGSETILLVEDEAILRELIRDVLQEYKYDVLEAGSGVEALRVWDEHNGRVDLLLTDMVMPEGMTGRDLATQLKQRKPELKVIFSSGYSAEITGRGFGQSDTVFLPKPYKPPQLAKIVRQCLDAPVRRIPEPELALA